MLIEICSFGFFSQIYTQLDTKYQKIIAEGFAIDHVLLKSWIHSTCVVRNICAHHARLWNRTLGVYPKIPKRNALPVKSIPNKVATVILVLLHLLDVISSKTSQNAQNLRKYIKSLDPFYHIGMGFDISDTNFQTQNW